MSESPAVVGSVLDEDPQRAVQRLHDLPADCRLVELRGDRLDSQALLQVVRDTRRPLIVTLRRPEDGGSYRGSEERRRTDLLAALEAGAAWIDVEWNRGLRDLALGPLASRIVLSHHGLPCEFDAMHTVYREMAATAAPRLKIVARADRPQQVSAVRDLLSLARRESRQLACFASGRFGASSRLLAPFWGSWGSYGAGDAGRTTARGQFPVKEMLGLYDVLSIGSDTRLFALTGNGVLGSPSPAMHMAAYAEAGIDARYLPIESERFEDTLALIEPGSGALQLDGLAVTIPFKLEAARWAEPGDSPARLSGSVNTVLLESDRRRGFNTDGPAVVALVGQHCDLRKARVLILGAGGTARAAAVAFREAGAQVAVANRTLSRAEEMARQLGLTAHPWEDREHLRWDVLIQATSLGSNGERVMLRRSLRGRVVLDAVYGKETPLVREAQDCGLAVMDGLDLLVAQGVLQFERMVGVPAKRGTMRRAALGWLGDREPDGSA